MALCPLVAAIDERNGDIEIGGISSWGWGLFAPLDVNASLTEQASNARTIELLRRSVQLVCLNRESSAVAS